jgi:hypothetical protein
MMSSADEAMVVQAAIETYIASFAAIGIFLRVRRNFAAYATIRAANGDLRLNQAFDPRLVEFADHDFWILAENESRAAIATYCLRRFVVDDFYDLIRSQALWFRSGSRPADPRFVVSCAIPPFGGRVVHGGGHWIRPDYRGLHKLAVVLPRLARAIALRCAPFDHDSAMIRNDPQDGRASADRKAVFAGVRIYGYARVHRFVDGWFPPEDRNAIMYLCHATRAEAVASLRPPLAGLPLSQASPRAA